MYELIFEAYKRGDYILVDDEVLLKDVQGLYEGGLSSGSYTIQPGDTLSEIAQRAGTSVQSLLAANPRISDPDRIYAGDTINLPGSGSTSGSSSGSSSGSTSGSSSGSSGSYTVQSGDTLSEIAQDNNTTVDALMDANPDIDDPDTIYAGDSLNVPGSSDSSSGSGGGKPILLDLDGDGVEITPLDSSAMYFDMSGDGLQNRTASSGLLTTSLARTLAEWAAS